MLKKLPVVCPSCSEKLVVERMRCPDCETAIEGGFSLPLLGQLNADEQAFIFKFVQSSGSLKEISRHMGMSYPTVRNILNDLIEKLNELKK